METFPVQKILSSKKIGSSWPLLVEANHSKYILKLSGTGQGFGVLVSEVIAAEIADRIDLPVPSRVLLEVNTNLIREDEDQDPELVRLLRSSLGINLGFEYIEHAKLISENHEFVMNDSHASNIFWFDWLVENPDRTKDNPNILVRDGNYWLIDHGASLPFQYNLPLLTEDAPAKAWTCAKDHLFYDRIFLLEDIHRKNFEKLSLSDLEIASWTVPDEFLQEKDGGLSYDEISRKKELFAVYLWKRIKSFDPGQFLDRI